MKRAAYNLRARLVEIVTLVDSPAGFRDFAVEGGRRGRYSTFVFILTTGVRVLSSFGFPCENGTISADSVYLRK